MNRIDRLPCDVLLAVDSFFPIPKPILQKSWEALVKEKIAPILVKWESYRDQTDVLPINIPLTQTPRVTPAVLLRQTERVLFLARVIDENTLINFNVQTINHLFNNVFNLVPESLYQIVNACTNPNFTTDVRYPHIPIPYPHRTENTIMILSRIFKDKLILIDVCKQFLLRDEIQGTIRSRAFFNDVCMKLYGQTNSEVTIRNPFKYNYNTNYEKKRIFEVNQSREWKKVKKITLVNFGFTIEDIPKLFSLKKAVDITKCDMVPSENITNTMTAINIIAKVIAGVGGAILCIAGGVIFAHLMGFSTVPTIIIAPLSSVILYQTSFLAGILTGALIGYSLYSLWNKYLKYKGDIAVASLQEKINKAVEQNNRLA